MPGLIARGVEVILASEAADAELRELARSCLRDEDAAVHVRQTIEAMPALLVAITRDLASADEAPRRLFHAIVDYLIQEENLIPSHAGRPLLGLLDDVYLVHVAAISVESHLGRVDMRSVAGGAQLLEQILPRGISAELRGMVDRAR
jgi:hypothetical protein